MKTWILIEVATGRILQIGDEVTTIYGARARLLSMRPPGGVIVDGRVSLSIWPGEYGPHTINAEWRQVPSLPDDEEG